MFQIIGKMPNIGSGNRPVCFNRRLFLLQISITEDGAAANFTRSFAMKSGYYLCYSKVTERDTVNTDDTSCPSFSALVLPVFLLQIVSLFLSPGLGRWYGSDRHSAHFWQGIHSSWLLLYNRAPWTKYVQTHMHSFVFIVSKQELDPHTYCTQRQVFIHTPDNWSPPDIRWLIYSLLITFFSLMDMTCIYVCVVCVFRGHCFEEEARVCACRPSGQCGHSCVGCQTDSQKQNDVAAPHIRGVGDIYAYKYFICISSLEGIS